ncbi:hypothetical protein NDU88_004328 [Pleurodeles waltl]|uniref:ABC transporter domain-containing protein n=1 Tax=Pleurodeles waltl TaxID=8319 RepID=A0AAV7VIJ2_PLEWA|nr:hypothetical protein NDU88_004328 [Pleurodeles waltl]
MGYSRQQFQALFWKNWLCRVRQPVLCLSEVLWPCILFLILAAVRYQEPPKFIQKCYLEPRNLPSHGLYPFVQSLFCNAGSRCKNSSHTEVRSSAPRAARLETGQNNPFENEEAFLRELQDLADGILEITTKATSLQELWEGSPNGPLLTTVDLNKTEEMISELESLHNQPYIWDLLLSLPLLAGNIQKDGFLNTGFQGLSQLLQTIRNSLTAVDILNVLPDNTMKDDFHRKIDKGLNISIMLLNFLHDWRSKQDLRFNLSLQYVVWNPESVIEELQSRFGLRSQQAEKVLNFTSVFKMVPTHGELEELICSAVSSAVDIPGENASQASRCASSWKEATNFLVQSIDKLELYKQAFFQWNISSMMQVMLQEIENSLHNSSDDSLVEKLVSVLNHIIQVSRGHSEEPQDLVVPSIKKDVKMKEGTYFKEEAMVFISNLAEYVKQLFNSNDSFPSSIPEMRALIDNILDHATTGIHSLSNVTAEESDDDLQMLSGFIDEILDRVHLITSLWPEDQSSEYFWQIMMTPILNEFVLALQNPVADGHLKSDMLKHLWLTFVSFSTPEEQEMLNTSLHFFKTFHSDMKGLPAGDVDYAKLGELFMTDLSKIGLLDQAHGAAILNLVNFIKNASASEKLSYAENIFQAGELEKILKDLHHNMSDDSQRSATMLLEILTTINHNADTFFNIKPNVSLFGSLDDISKVTSPMLRQFDIPIIRRNFTFLDGAIKVLQDLTHGSLCEQILSVYTFLEDYAQYCTQNGDVEMQLVTSDMLNEFVEVHPPPSLLESDVTQLLGLLRRETYVDPSDGTSMAMILMDALLKYIQQTFHMKSNENIFKPTQQDNSGDDDIMHLPNLLQGIMEMFSNESTQFSRNETNGNIHAAFDEYWQLALQNNESFFEVCQHLEASVDPAHVELLQKAQTALLNILTVLAENPVFTRNSHCIFSSCQGRSTRRFLVSMIEGFNLLHTQDLKAVWPESVNIDCASVDSTSQELSMMLNTMKQFVQDPEFNTICQCILPLDNIQEHLKNLEGSLSELLSRNPAIAFLSNSSMPAGIKVRDCVQNVTALETDIHALINISDRTINTILEANLSSSKFVYSTLAMALVEECNEEVLGLLLTFPKGEDTPLALEELCSLSTMEIYKLSVLIMEHLDLRNIMYKVKIPSDKNTMLTTLLDLVSRVSAIVDKLQNIVGNLPDFSKAFQSIPLVDVSEFQQFLRAGQSRRSAFGSLQSLIKSVCKEESNFFTNDDMFARMPQITELLKKDMEKYSIPENSTQFCLQFYQEILQSPNGALVWTFLKPLLHGKILYTPDLPEIRLVVEKANHIFDHVKSLKTYSEAWLSMSQIFQTTGQFLMVNHLQMFLQNNFIRNFVESQLNIDLKKLIENLQEYGSTMNKMLNNTATKQINMLSQFMVDISSCVLLDRFQPLNTSEELEQKATELMQQNNFLASIIFNVSSSKSREEHKSSHPLPPHVFYTIRTSVVYSMKTDNTKNPMWKSHPQQLPAAGFAYNHVFAPLQDMVERAITSVQTGKELLEPEVQVQAMPYPCHTSDLFLTNIGFFFPLIMMLTWMISVASMVRKSVHEKEIRLEEYMKMMGVHPSVHFLAWVLENIIMLAISSCTLVVILKVSGILFQSNGFILFIFFIDFGIAVIMMSYLISAFFSSANTACLCASLIYMISFLPYIVLLVLQKQFSLVTQTIVCLLSTTAFGQGIFLITFFEGQGTGIQWSNFYQPLEEAGAMNFGWASGMILIDSLIYFVAGWYFSNVIPGTFGSAKPWYFPLTVSYWKNLCGAENRRKHYLNSNMVFFNENLRHKGSLKHDSTTAGLERPPPGLEVGVDIMSVTKEYAGNTIAVNNLSLSFFKGQITALLGPNGAGKTTIISMLTGLYPASYGDILINGKDIHTELTSIRMEMGVCPQYDVLFDTLTVQEHLLLYGTVKAPFWGKKTLQLEVKRALQDVGLVLHKNKRVQALSGGMKRRLSIAISFMGNSRTVVLDEPTSGVDPCSRRSIWEILLKYKTGRTIIFTTHHLDEAEVLSDRIAILQHGQLRCCGSPCYLKERFGQGHSITLTRKHSMFDNQDPEGTIQITSLVQSFIPNAFLKEKSSTEITYMIPAMAEKAAFEQLFQALDENMQMLHLTGYGISDTTLEEIFLKLIQHPEEQPPIHLDVDLEASQGSEPVCHNNSLLMEAGTLEGWCLTLTQITSLLIKQFHHQRRDWRGALSKLFLPIVFVIMAMALFTLKPLTIEYPSLKLSPELYNGPSGCFYSADGVDSANLSHVLLRQFVGRDSLCNASRDDMRSYTCWSTETGAEHAFIEHCPYLQGQKKCPACNISAPYLKNSRGQVLYNLSGLDLEEYLITPLKRERFGGWSFGTKTSLKSQDKKPTKPQAKVWYSHKGFHALPSYLNQMNNMILWRNLPSTLDWKQYGITLYSKPYGGTLLNEDKILENVRQCGVALCIMLGFSILTASIGSAIVKDRVSGAKRLQHIAGLNYQVYWLANFIYDMLFYLVPVCLCVCVIAAFQLTAFTFRENLAATALLLTLFGYATLPWMYLISRFFSSSDVAFITYISINFVCGLCTLFLTLLPKLLSVMSKSENLTYIYSILRWAFLIFPQFCLGQGLMELSYNQAKFDLTSSFGIDSYVSPFQMDFLGWIFVAMALQGSLLLLLRLLLHWDLLQNQRGRPSVHRMISPSGDQDVEAERVRVFAGYTGKDILMLYNLRKCYKRFNKKTVAVNDISLGIPRGECFGLLGVNGAGKSTTFKMLTSDIPPTAGQAVIRTPSGSERDILDACKEGTLIGYCPQQDALDELLTGWEHLYYYCSLRGIPKQYIHKVSRDLVNRLHLGGHVDKLVKTYSGGTKRKLSTALALVGKPQILLLDEPSSGMDPCSKRYLWKTILKEVQDGCAAVLTSHSMEECEALCSRLAIMVNGSFKCLGSPQHIKNRFGDGYSVKVWLTKDANSSTAVSDCLKLHFPGTLFKEQHLNLLEYRVLQRKGCLAELFKTLETNKHLLHIEHYSISETSLEQVFINFAAQSHEASGCIAESVSEENTRYVLS